MVNWNDLRYLLAIHQSGTLAEAARVLKVDQTTVSRRLTALEEALGARLFERKSDGLTLTPVGQRAIAHASSLAETVNDLESSVRSAEERAEGPVRVAASENFAVPFLLERILSVRRRNPGIDLEVVTSLRFVNLLRGEADIAVRVSGRPPSQDKIVTQKVTEIDFALYASRTYVESHPRVEVGDGLRGQDVILFDEELAETTAGRWVREHATNGRPTVRVNSLLGAAVAATTGNGLAFLPCYFTGFWPALERVPTMPVVTRDVWLLVRKDLQYVTRVRVVMEHIVEELAASRALLKG